MRNQLIRVSLFLLTAIITACASSSKTANTANIAAAKTNEAQQIIGNIPSDSPFAKIKIGMPFKQVHDLIGEPTDTGNHLTGKQFVPFYFGRDTVRMEDFYKGLGRIVYSGAGMGGVNFKVYQVIYDTTEDGYNN